LLFLVYMVISLILCWHAWVFYVYHFESIFCVIGKTSQTFISVFKGYVKYNWPSMKGGSNWWFSNEVLTYEGGHSCSTRFFKSKDTFFTYVPLMFDLENDDIYKMVKCSRLSLLKVTHPLIGWMMLWTSNLDH
jgi:hypothetical protein